LSDANPYRSPQLELSAGTASDATLDGSCAGWLPIVASSALFALMHLGHGPAPIPLFFLAMTLGYIYQRTHRVLPCIIVHALLNGTSLAMVAVGIE
jgi:membrane protease YdiL (CAAX protease family)